MFRRLTTCRITTVAFILCAAGVGSPAWAQHGSHGGHSGGSGHGGASYHGATGHDGFGGHSFGGHSYGGHGYGGHGYSGHGYSGHGYGVHGYLYDEHDYYYSPSHLGLYYGSGYVHYGSGYYADSSSYGYDYGSPYTYSAPAGGCGSRAYYARTGPVVRTTRSGCGGGSGDGGRSTAVAEAPQPGLDYGRAAEEAFRVEEYDHALRLGNHALVETPRNGKLHLFVSLVLFATGDYPRAAAAIHEGTSLLEPKDWGWVVQNYRNYYSGDAYIKQMDRLEKFVEENPDAAYARLLRGYHFGFLGYREDARRDLAKVVELEGRDPLAARLLEMFAGETLPDPAEPEDAADLSKAGAKDHGTSETVGDMHAQDEHLHDQH